MEQTNKVVLIKNIYFYLVSFVALMMMVFSTAELINNLLKMYVFTKADNYGYYSVCQDIAVTDGKNPSSITPDQCEKQNAYNNKMAEENRASNLQRSIVNAISFFIIGLPLFILHWRVVRRKE